MAKNNLPGDPSLVSSMEQLEQLVINSEQDYKYEVVDYFQKPDKYSFKLSPDGLYLSYMKRNAEGKSDLYLQNTSDQSKVLLLKQEKEIIRAYGWGNADRLLYIMDTGGDENYQLYSINTRGEDQLALTPFDKVKVSIINSLKNDKEHIIISMNKDNEQVFEPYKINIYTGDLVKLYQNDDIQNPIASYDFDKDGILRAFTKQHRGTNYILHYKDSDAENFRPIIETSWKESFGIIAFDYQEKDIAYVATNVGRDKIEIIRYDLKNAKELETVFSNDIYDVGGISRSRKRNYEIDFFYFNGEKSIIQPVSKTFSDLYRALQVHIGHDDFGIVSTTEDETKMLILESSDRLYGRYHTYDLITNKLELLVDLMPQLDPEDMSTMRPIHLSSRDGLTLRGYLSLPKDVKSKIPLIINPHGGPYGIRDSWGFNPEAQLFCSRSYACLQINYRGSGGYGKEFYLAGSKQIGRKMLEDLEDAVDYVIDQFPIDKDKVAIYGASYGGLATLGSLVKTPKKYACGVDYVGVSNLFTFTASFPAYWKPYMAQFFEQWYDENDPKEKEIMKAVSPALNVEKIEKPLFVVQGANDPRVNIDESDQIVKNLRSRNVDVPYMVKYNEGHGFAHEENKLELYRYMIGFFAKYLD